MGENRFAGASEGVIHASWEQAPETEHKHETALAEAVDTVDIAAGDTPAETHANDMKAAL